jgi:hypothetical protein
MIYLCSSSAFLQEVSIMFKRTLLLVALAVFAGPTDPAHAGGKNVAMIDYR